ncbi:uncharacterized protein LOC123294332 [Chrysoperla carnea]|uniref:uncharacterized protein LOC123294332 n=1 Tax=Chrysoperla carnea TaxID=189513 RepID=UPI001D061549|nr:uncharacterized protein LOC123294332 [Chrysoperla carnea]
MELGENSQNLRGKSSYKYCFVPQCKNTSKSTPEKLFISVPKGDKRAKWVKQVRYPLDVSATSRLHCCEDHFDLQNDLKNYMRVKLDPNANILLKDDVLPTFFDCQSDRKRAWTSTERPGAKKLRHARTLAEIEEDLARSISLTSAGAVGETTVDESTTASSTSDFFPLDTSGSSAITEVGTRSLDVHLIIEEKIKLEKQLNTELIIKEEILEDSDVKMEIKGITEVREDSFSMECGPIKNEVLEDSVTMEYVGIKCEKLEIKSERSELEPEQVYNEEKQYSYIDTGYRFYESRY